MVKVTVKSEVKENDSGILPIEHVESLLGALQKLVSEEVTASDEVKEGSEKRQSSP